MDGVAVDAQQKSWSLAPQFAHLGSQVGGGQFWEGLIDDVRVYARTLTPSEVAVLAAAP